MGNLRTVLAVSVAALLLAACTGTDPEPTPSASPTATPTSPVSATATPSPTGALTTEELLALLPEGADTPDVQGAIITAEFFVELYAPMFYSGDTTTWRALSTADCKYCADALDNVATVWDRGWTAQGGAIRAYSNTSRGVLRDSELAEVKFDADFGDAYLVRDAGTPELTEKGALHTVFLELVLIDGVWRVNGVSVGE